MHSVQTESGTVIVFAEPGDTTSFPINSIPGVPGAGPARSGWIRRRVEQPYCIIVMSKSDAQSQGIAIPIESLAHISAPITRENLELRETIEVQKKRIAKLERRISKMKEKL